MLGKAQAMPEAVHILCSLGLMRVCALGYYFLGIALVRGAGCVISTQVVQSGP